MKQKIHEYKGNAVTITNVMKWLRKNGEPEKNYRIIQSNYRVLRVEFFDSKLELMYIMQYDWGNNVPK